MRREPLGIPRANTETIEMCPSWFNIADIARQAIHERGYAVPPKLFGTPWLDLHSGDFAKIPSFLNYAMAFFASWLTRCRESEAI